MTPKDPPPSGESNPSEPSEGDTESEGDSPDGDTPETDAPENSQPDSATPAEEDAAPTEPDVDQVFAVKKALAAARQALGKGDIALAEEQVDQATLAAAAPSLAVEVDRVTLLVANVKAFWDAVKTGMSGLKGADELTVAGQIMSVVDVREDSVVVRAAGQRKEYSLKKMPKAVAVVLAERSLDMKAAKSKVYLAAYLMIDPKGDRGRSRQLLKEASEMGEDVAALLVELGDAGRR